MTALTVDARGVQDLPGWVRRSWLIPLVLGILLTLAGVILLVNVGAGIQTLRWLVVIDLVLAGAQALATSSLRQRPWVGWLVGAVYLLGAIVGIAWPGITLLALVVTVGVCVAVGGVVQAIQSWQMRGTAQGWGWGFALGLISVLAGLVLLFGNPVISLAALAIVLACYVIVAGVTLLMLAFSVRRLTQTVAAGLRA